MEKTPENDPLLRPVPFGRPMRETHFLLHPDHISLNHASFGTYPKYVQRRMREIQDQCEARPDAFLRNHYPKMLDESRAVLAEYLGVPVDEIVLVPNASVATNTVLRNLRFQPGDVILHLSTAYGAVVKTIESLKETTPGLDSVNVEITYPLADRDLLDMFRAAIAETNATGQTVRVANIDTISSLPGVRMPWESMVQICKENNVLSLVDGAHGAGHIELNLAQVQPDFFATNLHKWLFVPRACAAFHVPKRNQHLIRTTLPTSHGFQPLPELEDLTITTTTPRKKKGKKNTFFNPLPSPPPESHKSTFERLFDFVGTFDVAPYLCISAALAFRRAVCGGEAKIMQYCHDIAVTGALRMISILYPDEQRPVSWTTAVRQGYLLETLSPAPSSSLQEGQGELTGGLAMLQIRLPLSIVLLDDDDDDDAGASTSAAATSDAKAKAISMRHREVRKLTSYLSDTMINDFDAFAPCVFHAGRMWVRVSGQIYLDEGDFDRGGECLRDVCQRVRLAGGVP